jgi:hypothetical protein
MPELLLDAVASAPSHAATFDPAANVEFRPKKAGSAMPGMLGRWELESLVDTTRMFNSRQSTRDKGRWLLIQQSGNGVWEQHGIDAADLPESAGACRGRCAPG